MNLLRKLLATKSATPILSIWLAFIIIGFFSSRDLNQHLTTSLSVPGSQSEKANLLLAQEFNENTEGTFTIIYKYGTATSQQIAQFEKSIERAISVIPNAQVSSQKALVGTLYASVTTSYSLLEAAKFTEDLRQSLKKNGLSGAQVTGPPAIESDVSPVLANDLHRGQALAIVLALLLLLLMLGSTWAIFIPLLFALSTVSLSLCLINILSRHFVMVLYIPNIVELIGLGLAIDYSLLMLHRYRRELTNCDDPKFALHKTMQTAGRTVVLSGITVSLSLSTLLLVPVPFIKSLGLAGMLVPLISIVAALTLQPVLLAILGKRVFSDGFNGIMGTKNPLDGIWAKLTRWVISHAKAVFVITLTALLLFASFAIKLEITPSSLTAIPSTLESGKVINSLTSKIGPGVITPHEIVIDLKSKGLATVAEIDQARLNLATTISKNPKVFIVASGKESTYVDATGRYIRMYVIGKDALGEAKTRQLVQELRVLISQDNAFPKGTQIYLGGSPAQGVDLIDAIFASLPWIIFFALFITFVVLARAMRSILLAIKAIVMDLISITVALAGLVLVFKFGFGAAFLHTYQVDQIEAWVLIFMFAVLFGLSMDYELFLVSRMREAKDSGLTNHNSIIEGIANTSGVVTGAAIILVGALSGFVFGHFAGLQELGIGLAIGITIDATIIRGLLLPSAMVLLGRWNWWLPKPVAALLNTKASPLEAPEARL